MGRGEREKGWEKMGERRSERREMGVGGEKRSERREMGGREKDGERGEAGKRERERREEGEC